MVMVVLVARAEYIQNLVMHDGRTLIPSYLHSGPRRISFTTLWNFPNTLAYA